MHIEADPFSLSQHGWIHISEQLQETPRSGDHSLIFALPILDQITQQIILHTPRLPLAHFSDCVDSCGNDFRAYSRMHKFLSDFAHNRCKHIWRSKFMDRLSQGYENEGDLELMVCEISGINQVERLS